MQGDTPRNSSSAHSGRIPHKLKIELDRKLPLGLGDLLTAVPALRGLRSAYPDHHLVLAAPAPLRELATLTAVVDDLLPFAADGASNATARWGPLRWRQTPPAIAVNLYEHPRLARAATHHLAHPRRPGAGGPGVGR
ncbi:MAG: hypothetical protein ABIZ05_14840 [Pseudonocardiaceae bacterium]